jgi:hypothetical protein
MVVVMVIVHLGHHLFRAVLDRQGGARIDQRQRLRSFGRSGQSQKCAECCKTQNSRRTLVPFIDILLQLRDNSIAHASAVRLPHGNCPAATQTQARVTT